MRPMTTASRWRPRCAACTRPATRTRLRGARGFSGTPLGKNPGRGRGLGAGLGPVVPFLEYGPALRRVLCTTNAIEAFNREMRKC